MKQARHGLRICAIRPLKARQKYMTCALTSPWSLPQTLSLAHEQATGATTHLLRLRLKTMPERGSALLDPEASVQLYLMSEDGAALLCRLPAFSSKAARRFQEGATDEVELYGPPLGRLQACLLGPDRGTWACDTLEVQHGEATDRFVCRQRLGLRGAESAALLLPMAEGSVLVGSRVLDPDEAAAMRAAGMQAFSSLSLRLGWGGAAGAVSAVALTTLALGPGAGTAAGVGGAGGLVGLAVQSAYVARLGNGEGNEGMAGLPSLLSGPVRVALPALLLLAGYKALQHWDGLLDVPPSTRILCVLGGYLGYKAGVILAAALTKDA
ncbi:hypothetical protein ACKKBG_A38905 [Auxenochlorella protothecoides x Auxenochlorella symbiontica]